MNREYRNIDATLTGLNKSSDAHFKWLVKILYCVANKKSIQIEIANLDAHENCEFGLWLAEELKDERDDTSYLIDIYKRHGEIHQACRHLLTSLYEGKMSADQFEDFSAALLRFNNSLAVYKMHLLQRRTNFDALTGLPLRRTLDESFDNTVAEYANDGLYLFLLDIDHFKKINDNYGHLIGDDVLRSLALQLEERTRRNEPVYRYGGEEFIILLHVASDKEASTVAERLRASVAATEIITGEHRIHIAFSAGLTRVHSGESLHEVLERADSALYHGKQTGRNRCVFVDKQSVMRRIVL